MHGYKMYVLHYILFVYLCFNILHGKYIFFCRVQSFASWLSVLNLKLSVKLVEFGTILAN